MSKKNNLKLADDRQSLSGIVSETIPAGAAVTIRKVDGEYRLIVEQPDLRAIPKALRHIPGLRAGNDRSFATFRSAFQK